MRYFLVFFALFFMSGCSYNRGYLKGYEEASNYCVSQISLLAPLADVASTEIEKLKSKLSGCEIDLNGCKQACESK
jgi:hypothetical protein